MFDPKRAQQRLNDRGCPLAIDGVFGPRSFAAAYNVLSNNRISDDLALQRGRAAVQWFGRADLMESGLRLAHFFGQTFHESMGFTHTRELWGPTPAQVRYEGRKDLGNTQPGDGKRFMGRGDLQTTGRANYRAAGQRLGLPLEAQPELAEAFPAAIAVSVDYWAQHGLNRWADIDDTLSLSRAINLGNTKSTGTPNGLSDRQAATARARAIFI